MKTPATKLTPVFAIALALLLAPLTAPHAAEVPKPVAWWTCDENVKAPALGNVFDSVGKVRDRAAGFLGLTNGVSRSCLKFDGFTTHVIRKHDQLPVLGDAFTFEAWVAPQEYPWNGTAILNQEREHKAGWFFGISGEGRVGLQVAIGDKWIECNSKSQLPLLKWSHVMGAFDAREGLKVYINGKLEGVLKAAGSITPAADVEVWMGIHRSPDKSEAVFLYGMTDQPVTSRVPLARSWNSPPALALKGSGFQSQGYDKFQRAYVIERLAETAPLEFTLAASEESPLVNPAFVIKNWGNHPVSVQLNGQEISRGKALRCGLNRTVNGQDLLVWVKMNEVKATSVRISSQSK